ncbi:preprotein translocase subunit SecA, partial [Akkermansia muciniphila]
SGMTGTALTEEDEFREIYNLDVIEIPTNRPLVRKDQADVVYKTEQGKFNAVIEQIIECKEKGQPVLVGTISIEKSELLSKMLKKRGVKHEVLNAKYHEKEAEIVSQAGKFGAVTIATNMAGRGTDIVLGGNAEMMAKDDLRKAGYYEELISEATGHGETDDDEILAARKLFAEKLAQHQEEIEDEAQRVKDAGGLYILGTERHESRRIDNQLRGRSGRQGDPGESRFFLSLEDDLIRLFGGERIQNMMDSFGLDEDVPIENKILTGTIESAQRKIEGRNFGIRKNVLQYDDVMNKQREIIYGQRAKVLDGDDISSYIQSMVKESIESSVNTYIADDEDPDNWNIEGLVDYYNAVLFSPAERLEIKEELEHASKDEVKEKLLSLAEEKYKAREARFGSEMMREL